MLARGAGLQPLLPAIRAFAGDGAAFGTGHAFAEAMAKRKVRVLMMVGDTDLGRMLRDHLVARGYEIIEPAGLADAGQMARNGSADVILGEADTLDCAGISECLPTLCLAAMGACHKAGDRLLVLTKPASLRVIEDALRQLSGA